MDLEYSVIEFYDYIKIKYKDYLRPEIVGLALIQDMYSVSLESLELEITKEGFEKHTTKRRDLYFITDEYYGQAMPYFHPSDPIEENVRKFIEDFDAYSIAQATDLFHEDACEKLAQRKNISIL